MNWDISTLTSMIDELRAHGGDFTLVEVKRGRGGCPDVATTLCAFGNMPDGGVIIVGLDEGHDFAPVGVRDPARIEQGIASQARTAVTPPVSVSFNTVSLTEAAIVIVTVAGLPASDRPCRTSGRAYLRQADGDYMMSPQEEQQMLTLRNRPRHDTSPVDGSTVADLDETFTQLFLSNARAASRRLAALDNEMVLRRKGVLEPRGPRLTLSGLYALGQYPQQFAPNLSVTAAVVPDRRTPARLIDLVHLDGPIPELLDASMEWLRRNLRSGIRVDENGHNYTRLEFPLAALREVVANALVHRDLGPNTQSKRVEIRLRDDRLVISNPGGLWGVSRGQLGLPGGKSAVNEHLYDICTLVSTAQGARVIEGEGGGISEAQQALSAWPADAPIFIDKAVSFTTILMRTVLPIPSQAVATDTSRVARPSSPLEHGSTADRILAALRTGPLDRRTISELTGLTPSATRYALTTLVKRGQVTMKGGVGARNTTYALAYNGRDDRPHA